MEMDLSVGAGELVFVIGPSGCGKSTLLRAIDGLEEPSNGSVAFHDGEHAGTPRIAFIFQEYGVFPCLTVAENAAFGLRMEGVGKEQRRDDPARGPGGRRDRPHRPKLPSAIMEAATLRRVSGAGRGQRALCAGPAHTARLEGHVVASDGVLGRLDEAAPERAVDGTVGGTMKEAGLAGLEGVEMTGRHTSSWIVDAVRTPIGRLGGGLASVRPDDLAAGVVGAVMARSEAPFVEDVYFGDANGAGEDNRNVARMALLLAGLDPAVPGATVNRLCGSGMEAVVQASRAIEVGDAEICLAGGVESMSRAPYVLPKPTRPYPHRDETLYSSTLGWRMVNPRFPRHWTVSLGECAELLSAQDGITRDEQDRFALESHEKATLAWKRGAFRDEVVEVKGVVLEHDESIRPDTSLEKLATLRPAFREDGTVTAGNASPLNDGAAAVLVVGEGALRHFAQPPLARIAARATAGVEPQLFGLGPVDAANEALRRAGIGWDDLAVVELNEAFAAQALACLRRWPDFDPVIVNPRGGAIAIGHPLGCSGARLVATLAHQLHERGGGFGLATMCIGVGQGIAVVLEA